MRERLRTAAEHLYMLAVCFFLLWNVFYMTEAQWLYMRQQQLKRPAAQCGEHGRGILEQGQHAEVEQQHCPEDEELA